MRFTTFITSIIFCGTSFAFDRPSEGVDVDERREVRLLRSPPKACLSLPFGDFALLLSVDRMNSLIYAEPEKWSSEPERLAAIAARRAAALLSVPRRPADSLSCQALAAPIPEEVKFLLINEIEEGAAAIVNSRSGAFLERVEVHYIAVRCGSLCGHGDILVRAPGQVLFGVRWWDS
jgi:hypothetical protein